VSNRRPTLTVVVPVLDERTHLPGLLASIRGQSLPPDEVILVDGMSRDGSREWLADAARSAPWLRLVDNPDRIVPCAMNRGILAARGDLVARMDGHATYAPDYLERLVEALRAHPEAAGSGGVYAMSGSGPWGGAIAAILRHRLALGGAPHRTASSGRWVDHVGTGCYRREALLRVHGFDPSLPVNEDFELDYRIRATGGRIWLEPSARFTSYSRSSPRALARQMWRYGFYKARTLVLHPASLKARQTAPPIVVGVIITTLVVRPRSGLLAAAGYAAASAAAGATIAARAQESPARGALALPLVHLAWGSGLWAGLLHHGVRRLTGRGTMPPHTSPRP